MSTTGLRSACSNCGEAMQAHCRAHLIPCCPHYRLHASDSTPAPLDVERLARALIWLDNDEPGVLNDISIDDEAAEDVAPLLADRYARLTGTPEPAA